MDAPTSGQFTAGEGGDGLVVDGGRAGEAYLQTVCDLLVEFGSGDGGLLEGGLPSLGGLGVERVGMVMSALSIEGGIEGGGDSGRPRAVLEQLLAAREDAALGLGGRGEGKTKDDKAMTE